MRLTTTRPVPEQIEEHNHELYFDLRNDAMGDKAAFTSIINYLLALHGPITILECENGRTPFMLRDYYNSPGVQFISMDPLEDCPGLDLCTTGLSLPCNWELHSYLASKGIRPSLQMESEKHKSIIFAIRTHATYDQRKNMNLDRARETIDELCKQGYPVEVLYDREDPLFPEVKQRTMRECIALIAGARAFIGGDTGFSHVAAGLRIPQVAIYPDYFRFGKASLTKAQAIAEWWGLPELIWTPFNSLPNNACMVPVELGTDHCWSMEHVVTALERLKVGS